MKLTQAEARSRLGTARVARLATLSGGGAPHLVPITFALDGDDLYTAVDHKPKTTRRLRRLDDIAADPRVAVLADQYREDWDALWWVRVEGRATVITDAGAMRRPVDALVERYEQYRAQRPLGPVIAIRIERWTGWAASAFR
ncbi:MAG: TIGR03668 family PPOX class F420-dependent oxidoreductase [Microbacteriaceae bacterium]|nr:TIGR03668 family PPOX class F420-dependent oxidoreductase [Microbacteriaceae bacterium]